MPIEYLDFDPPRPYARASRAGDFIFLHGIGGQDVETGEIPERGIVPETELTFKIIKETLEAFGAGLEDIAKTTVYLVDMEDRLPFQEVRRRHLPRPVPSTLIYVKQLGFDLRVEVDVIAYKPARD